MMKKDDDSIAEEIEVARRELLQVQAAMEEIAGSGNAHRVGASLQVSGSKDRLDSSIAVDFSERITGLWLSSCMGPFHHCFVTP